MSEFPLQHVNSNGAIPGITFHPPIAKKSIDAIVFFIPVYSRFVSGVPDTGRGT